MQIDFYTTGMSPYCRAVKMLATHLNIPLNEIRVRAFTDSRSEAFKKINPCHILPTINDNGFILWESRAIMQYLCNKYAPDSHLYPKDPQLRATVERLLNFDLKTLSHAAMRAHFEYTLPNEYSASRTEKLVALTDALTFLEIFLINKDYVAGNNVTIADISLLANVTLLEITVEFEISSYPNIWGWINRLRRELPYYDQLTKVAHDEFREHIRELRDANEAYSAPHFCIFADCETHKNSSLSDQLPETSTSFLPTGYLQHDINSFFSNGYLQNENNGFLPNLYFQNESNGFLSDIYVQNENNGFLPNGYLQNGNDSIFSKPYFPFGN